MAQFEKIPPGEAALIESTVDLTRKQQARRYPSPKQVLRGVHTKAHGCVKATFTVLDKLPAHLRVGVFAEPGRCYDAWIRFSNADVKIAPDSVLEGSAIVHGSRGMAIKLLGVTGTPLMPPKGPTKRPTKKPTKKTAKELFTQDFLMINSPMFAFANVEDYEALSKVLQEHGNSPLPFFAQRIVKLANGMPDMTDPRCARAIRSAGIAARIKSAAVKGDSGAFQPPPLSPLDNTYFSAAPFLFGNDRVMKFAAKPVAPMEGSPTDVPHEDYLNKALHKRMTTAGARDVLFEFQVQVRDAKSIGDNLDKEIEDACEVWKESDHPFETVAMIAIPPQDINTEQRRRECEALVFTPWHGLVEHRPVGGINRLRRDVYLASSESRAPKKPDRPPTY